MIFGSPLLLHSSILTKSFGTNHWSQMSCPIVHDGRKIIMKHFLSLCYKPSSKDTEMDRVLLSAPSQNHSLPQPLTRSLRAQAHHLSHFLWLQPPPNMACHFCLPGWLQSSYDSRFPELVRVSLLQKEEAQTGVSPMILFCKIRLYCFQFLF